MEERIPWIPKLLLKYKAHNTLPQGKLSTGKKNKTYFKHKECLWLSARNRIQTPKEAGIYLVLLVKWRYPNQIPQ